MRKCLLLVSLILFFSCSPDSPDAPETSEGNLVKSEKKYAFGNLQMETNYYYNSDGTISKIDINSVQGIGGYEYFYGQNGKIETIILTLVKPFGDKREEHSTLSYEGDKIVETCTTVTLTEEDGSLLINPTIDKEELEYNSRGLVTKIIKYEHASRDRATCESLEYIHSTITMEYDSKGNLTRMEDTGNILSGSNYLTYTYDDTFHPFRNMKPDYFRNFYNFSSENNVIATEEFDRDTHEKVGYVEYIYEFSEENYPIRVDRKWSTVDGFLSQNHTFEYTYY